MNIDRQLLRGLLRPQGLVGVLVFACGLLVLASVPGGVRITPPDRVVLQQDEPPALDREVVELTVVDTTGQQSTTQREIGLPDAESARLRAILAALKDVLGEDGVWPDGLDIPTIFVVERFGRERVAVLDFQPPDDLAVTVEQEFQTLASIRRTLRAAGMDDVEVLVNDKASPTFLGHVALDAKLE
ncbi:MAG TPA: hypothetical protein VF171_02475 [Trueperaceae bacterium]